MLCKIVPLLCFTQPFTWSPLHFAPLLLIIIITYNANGALLPYQFFPLRISHEQMLFGLRDPVDSLLRHWIMLCYERVQRERVSHQ